jgi:hypothetical protein
MLKVSGIGFSRLIKKPLWFISKGLFEVKNFI